MQKILLSIATIMLSVSSLIAQMSISDARQESEGSTVTITGVVTNGEELGVIRYIQDPTGGMAVYDPSSFAQETDLGDSVIVTGVLKDFRGLLELDPVSDFEIISSGNALPDPILKQPNDIAESDESTLVRFENVQFVDGGTTVSSNNTYDFTSNGQDFRIFVRSNHPLVGYVLPIFNVSLTGIVSEFNGSYQLLLRGEDDIIPESSFFIDELPKQSNIETQSFRVSWTTSEPATSQLIFGQDGDFTDTIMQGSLSQNQSVDLTGLVPATIYNVKVRSTNGTDISESPIYTYATASLSSGEIKVYFNHDVDPSFSNGSQPEATVGSDLNSAFMQLIENAKQTIDMAAYNNNRTEITRALNEAHARGVRVRYIRDNETLNSALQSGIDFEVLTDANSPDGGLMHHKFIVVDAEDPDNCYVWTGSTNFTDENIGRDFNNAVRIQDQTLARAYTREFDEMWGSNVATPGIFSAVFGSDKTDNTPHLFKLQDGTELELYFSPSDNTSTAIERSVRSADENLMLALLTFTYNSLGTAVVDEHFQGTDVRVLLENGTDQGSEYEYLESRDVQVFIEGSSDQLHHKYGIVDEGASDPLVITGSHNWTNSAESRNDENALIIHSANIANIFRQEFEKRWAETTVNLPYVENLEGVNVSVYPNPFSDLLNINLESTEELSKELSIEIYSTDGTLVREYSKLQTGSNPFGVSDLFSGSYIVIIKSDQEFTYRKMLK